LINLKFRPFEPNDAHCIQAMSQGTEHSYLPFNCFTKPFFVATFQGNIVGFAYGQKSCVDGYSTLTIGGIYLRSSYDDDNHIHELQLAFINWAEKNIGVTHYKIDDFDAPKPIGISHLIPQQITGLSVPNEDAVSKNLPAEPVMEYAPS